MLSSLYLFSILAKFSQYVYDDITVQTLKWETFIVKKSIQTIYLLQKSKFTKNNYEMKCFTSASTNISTWLAEIRQSIFLCKVLVPHRDFNKPQPIVYALQGKE